RSPQLVGAIRELKGEAQTLQLRQQDFTQGPSDVYAVLWSAAGGFGDPLEREPAKVEADVHNGDVSAIAARDMYGVVLGDEEATKRRREELRARRVQGQTTEKAIRKLSGKVKLLATENIAIYDNQHHGCAKCGQDLGPVSHNYK